LCVEWDVNLTHSLTHCQGFETPDCTSWAIDLLIDLFIDKNGFFVNAISQDLQNTSPEFQIACKEHVLGS